MISNLKFDSGEPIFLQKSFAVNEDGVFCGFLSGAEFTTGVNRAPGRGFATTFKSREWLSLRDPDGLCSMVILPAIRAVVEVDTISSYKGITAWVPEFTIVGIANSVPSEELVIHESYKDIPRYASEVILQSAFDVEHRPSLRDQIFGRRV